LITHHADRTKPKHARRESLHHAQLFGKLYPSFERQGVKAISNQAPGR
jgi:hypothetical protein